MGRDDQRWADARDQSVQIERPWGRRASRDSDDPRESDGADSFTAHLDLPRGNERELAIDRDRTYELSGSESRALATVGAFRVVGVDDLRVPDSDPVSRRLEPDIQHLRESGLVETRPLDGCGREAVVLTTSVDTQNRPLIDTSRPAIS